MVRVGARGCMGLAARQRFRKESLGGKEENLMENIKDLRLIYISLDSRGPSVLLESLSVALLSIP